MVIPATGAPQNRSTTDWPARRWPASTHGGWAAWRDFRLGNLAATGLGDGSVDAVLCVDAILFSQQPDAAYCELPRVLGPGGRAVLTCSEPLGQGDERLPGRLWRVDLAARLTAVGFSTMEVRGRLGWRARERAMWQEAAALDPGDDPALQSFHDEKHALPRNPRPDTPGHRHGHCAVDAHSMR